MGFVATLRAAAGAPGISGCTLPVPPLAHLALPLPHPPCRSADPRFNSALQTLRVVDSRPLTGDSTASPRWITSLPFTDSDVTSRFTDKYPGGADSGVRRGAHSLGAQVVVVCWPYRAARSLLPITMPTRPSAPGPSTSMP